MSWTPDRHLEVDVVRRGRVELVLGADTAHPRVLHVPGRYGYAATEINGSRQIHVQTSDGLIVMTTAGKVLNRYRPGGNALAWAPDGRSILVAGAGGTLGVLSLATGRVSTLGTLRGGSAIQAVWRSR